MRASARAEKVPTPMPSCFDLAVENQTANLTLSRTEAFNSMPRAFWNELPALIREIDEEAKARVIVLASTGKHFTAGMDLSVFTDGAGMPAPEGDVHARAEAFRHFVLL